MKSRDIRLTELIGPGAPSRFALHDDQANKLAPMWAYVDPVAESIEIAYFLNDTNGDISVELDAYERRIGDLGGIDVIVHGIGENGHLAFNEPGAPFDSTTRIVDLDESTAIANSRFFRDSQ